MLRPGLRLQHLEVLQKSRMMTANCRSDEGVLFMKGCTRLDWSDEKNDYCMCDNLEEFAEVYGGSCEECRYWTDKEEQE